MRPRLRLFTGEDDAYEPAPTTTITFGELLSILEDAAAAKRTWLRDFTHDGIQIPEDLYEVLTEYTRLRPGA